MTEYYKTYCVTCGAPTKPLRKPNPNLLQVCAKCSRMEEFDDF
jgi:hypothetical protein